VDEAHFFMNFSLKINFNEKANFFKQKPVYSFELKTSTRFF